MVDTRKRKSPTSGKMVDAEVVDIENISERPTIILLADGTKLRMRLDVVEVVRFPGEYDREDHPIYQVKSGTVMAVLESPEHLKKTD